jgi:hypothetical protein
MDRTDLQILADARIEDAKVLLNGRRWVAWTRSLIFPGRNSPTRLKPKRIRNFG